MQNITKAEVEQFLRRHPGATQLEIAAALPTDDPVYGSHKFVAGHVASLRAEGVIADVPRCSLCGRATTRGHKNLPLVLL